MATCSLHFQLSRLAQCEVACSSTVAESSSGRFAARNVSQRTPLGSSLTGSPLVVSRKSLPVPLRRSLVVEAAKRVVSTKNYLMTATLVASEGQEAKVMELCKGVVAWADACRKEKTGGIIQFTCEPDNWDKNTFHFWEVYESIAALTNAQGSPQYLEFQNKVRPLLEGPIALTTYEYANGQIGHMLHPLGPKGEGGLDDATGQGTGGGASYTQTSATVDLGNMDRSGWGMEKMRSDEAATAKAKKDGQAEDEEEDDGKWSLKKLFRSLTK